MRNKLILNSDALRMTLSYDSNIKEIEEINENLLKFQAYLCALINIFDRKENYEF